MGRAARISTWLAAAAAVVFAYVALHELDYASAHPYSKGPANVIAVGAIGGVLLCGAVIALARGR